MLLEITKKDVESPRLPSPVYTLLVRTIQLTCFEVEIIFVLVEGNVHESPTEAVVRKYQEHVL